MSVTLQRTTLALVTLAVAATTARGDDGAQAPTAASTTARVPDASLRAVQDRIVRLELDGAPAVEGRLLGFEAASVTLALSGTNEVVAVPRTQLLRVIVVEPLVRPAERADAEPAPPEKFRSVGLQFGVPGTLVVDADYKLFHAFASANVLFPILTASGDSRWYAAAVGAGISLPMSSTSRWKLDVFGEVMPLHIASFYTYLATGIGVGFHHTAASGLAFGFTFPVFGFSTRLGSSPYGYDASFRYNNSLGYYYLAGLVGMPLVTVGYRFSSHCAM